MRTALIALLLPFTASAGAPTPDALASTLWRALSHAPGVPADTDALRGVFHPDAVVFGSRERDGTRVLERTEAADFIASQAAPRAHGFYECEITRRVEAHDRFALVTSVVESRTDPAAAQPTVVGINSLQLHRGEDGWRVLSLHYHLPAPAAAAPGAVSGRCLP